MAGKITRILGKLVSIGGYRANTCIPDTYEKLVEELVKSIGIELPAQDTDTFVTVSVTAPTDKSKLWLAIDTSGNVISLRKFVGTSWQELLPLKYKMLLPFYGVPGTFKVEGWAVADGTLGTVNTQAAWTNLPNSEKLFYAQYIGK
jgi:hypothetical protein